MTTAASGRLFLCPLPERRGEWKGHRLIGFADQASNAKLARWSDVVTRQSTAYRVARRLHDLRETRSALEARRADLERRIRLGSSRQVLVPLAERNLGLHQPSDSEYVLFVPPGPAREQR